MAELKILPNPFTSEDEAAGYRYELSILQAEFSLTQMLDRPVSGRIFFEQVLHDNLAIGRTDHVGLIFDRRVIAKGRAKTPGTVPHPGHHRRGHPSLHVDYKNTKVKQYHRGGRARCAPRPRSTHPRLPGSQTADQPARTATDRLLCQPAPARRPNHQPRTDPGRPGVHRSHRPLITCQNARIPGLRFGDARVHAPLQALLVHRLLVHGFTNRDLRTLIAPLLGKSAEDITAGQMTYDLRRPRAHGLIERVARTRRYRVTDTGLQHALLFTHAHDHLPRTGLAQVSDPSPPRNTKLHNAARAYQAVFGGLTQQAQLAA